MGNSFKKFLRKHAITESWGNIYIEYWLSPRGELIRALEGHVKWAKQHNILQMPPKLWMDGEYVYMCMAKKGYLRVTIEPGVEIVYQKYFIAESNNERFVARLNSSQRSTLIEMGRAKHLPAKGVGIFEPEEIVYSPHMDSYSENTVVGVNEPIEVEGLGTATAKVDSGNDGYNVIHGVNVQRLKNEKGEVIVKFLTIDNKTVSFKQIGWIEVIAGGKQHNRPVVGLNVKVKDKFFTNEPFSVADRSQNEEKFLLGVPFIKKMDAVIDVNKAGVVSEMTEEGRKMYNARIDEEIAEIGKAIKNLEDEREYADDHGGLPFAHFNTKIEALYKKIKELEGKKLVSAAMTIERLKLIRQNLNP